MKNKKLIKKLRKKKNKKIKIYQLLTKHKENKYQLIVEDQIQLIH